MTSKRDQEQYEKNRTLTPGLHLDRGCSFCGAVVNNWSKTAPPWCCNEYRRSVQTALCRALGMDEDEIKDYLDDPRNGAPRALEEDWRVVGDEDREAAAS